MTVHQQRTGHDIAGERSLRQAGDHPHEIVRCCETRLGAERGAHAMAPAAQIREHVYEQSPLRVGLRLRVGRRRRHVADVVEHDLGTEVVRKFKRPLRRGDPRLEPVGIGIAAACAKRHGRHHESLIIEPLADLPEARLRHLLRIEPAPRVDLHAADPEIVSPLEGSPQIGGEGRGGNSETGCVHASERILCGARSAREAA